MTPMIAAQEECIKLQQQINEINKGPIEDTTHAHMKRNGEILKRMERINELLESRLCEMQRNANSQTIVKAPVITPQTDPSTATKIIWFVFSMFPLNYVRMFFSRISAVNLT